MSVNILQNINNARLNGDYESGMMLAFDALNSEKLKASQKASVHLHFANMLNEMPSYMAIQLGYIDRRQLAAEHANLAVNYFARDKKNRNTLGDAYVAWGVALWFQTNKGPKPAKEKFIQAASFFTSDTQEILRKYVNAHHCIGLCEHTLGNLSNAATHFKEVLSISEIQEFDSAVLNARRCLANVYSDEGRLEPAADLLDVIKVQTGSDFISQIQWVNARVLVAEENGEFQLTHKLYDRVHDLFAEQKQPGPELGAALTNAASFKVQNGYPSQAKAILELAEKLDTEEAPFSFRIGLAKSKMISALVIGDKNQAISHLQVAKNIAQNDLDENKEQYLELLILESHLLSSDGEKKEWLSEFANLINLDKVLKNQEVLTGARLLALSIAGDFLLDMDSTNTLYMYQLLTVGFYTCCTRSSNENIWSFYSFMSRALAKRKKQFAAVFVGKLAVDAIYQLAVPVPLRSLQRSALLNKRKFPFEHTQNLLKKLGRFNEASNIRNLFRQDLLLNTGPARRHLQSSSEGLKYSDFESKWLEEINEIREYLIGNFNNPNMHNKLRSNKIIKDCDRFLQKLWNSNELKPTAAQHLEIEAFTPDVNYGHLHLLEVEEKIFCKLVTFNETINWNISHEYDQVIHLIHDLHNAVANEEQSWTRFSKELSIILLSPIFEKINCIESIIIEADGILGQIPFCCLYSGDQLLVEILDISYHIGRAAVIRKHNKITSNSKTLIGGVNEEFSSVAFLKNVEGELASIEQKFKDTKLLKGKDFTVKNFKNELTVNPAVVHLATHFQLHPGSPEKSYLVLSNGDRLHFSRLSASDFCWDSVDLLFLSACESATGDWASHEMDTVPALFRRLGVNEVIGTLWPVFDGSTSILVRNFYECLIDNNSPSQALKRAQIMTLENEGYNHPVHWAAFKCFI